MQQQLKFFKELLSTQNGQIKIFDRDGFVAVADTRHGWIWLSEAQILKTRDQSLNFTYATAHEFCNINNISVLNSNGWLWNVVWNSPMFAQQELNDGFINLIFGRSR